MSTPRERILEWQIKLLVDRLAIAYSRLEDNELTAFCEEGDEVADAWEEERRWLFGPEDDGWAFKRKAWRKQAGYKRAVQSIRDMLIAKLKAVRLRKAA